MSGNVLQCGAKKTMDSLYRNITILMAAAMMVYSVLEMYRRFRSGEFLIGMAHSAVPLACSLLIFLDRHRSIFFAVGLFAVSIGFSRFVKYIPLTAGANGESLLSMAMFYAGVALCVLALNMMYSGYRYIRRNSRSITNIIISASLFTLVIIADIVMDLRAASDTVGFLENAGGSIARLIMYVLYIGLVWSEPVRRSTDFAVTEEALASARISEGAGPDLSRYRETAERFVGFIGGGAGDLPAYGPVEARIRVMANDGLSWMFCDLERWRSGSIYISFSLSGKGSSIDPAVFEIRDASLEEDAVLIRYSGGRTGRFRIRSRDEDDASVSEAIA